MTPRGPWKGFSCYQIPLINLYGMYLHKYVKVLPFVGSKKTFEKSRELFLLLKFDNFIIKYHNWETSESGLSAFHLLAFSL
jgi:hypothetical protein